MEDHHAAIQVVLEIMMMMKIATASPDVGTQMISFHGRKIANAHVVRYVEIQERVYLTVV